MNVPRGMSKQNSIFNLQFWGWDESVFFFLLDTFWRVTIQE